MSLTDSHLIARVLADDDRHAFGELVRRHQSAVRLFLRRLTRGNEALADDLAQEAFIEAHRNISKFRGNSAFSTWLHGIAYNRFRNGKRRSRDEVEWTEHAQAHAAEEPFTRSEDLRHDLSMALAKLTSDEQASIHLCYSEGLSHQEAAQVLGNPLGTIKTHISRAKSKLRTQLRDWAPN